MLADFRKRFYAQFKRPDKEAPFEKKPKPGAIKLRRKQYAKLDNFIQAIIRVRLQQQSAWSMTIPAQLFCQMNDTKLPSPKLA